MGLERVLVKYLYRLDQVLDTLRLRAQEVASHIGVTGPGAHFAKHRRDDFERRLSSWFEIAIQQTLALIVGLRRTTYMLTYMGQAEAMGRAWGRETKASMSHDELRLVLHRDPIGGGSLHARIELSYHRLLRDVVDAFQLSQVMESPTDEVLSRIARAFPSKRKLPKRMAKLTEADKKAPKEKLDELGEPIVIGVDVGDGFSHFVSEQEWDAAVEDYTADYVPRGRGPYDEVFDTGPEGEDLSRYHWEIEQEVTDDFVQSVRSGDVDAANENGVNDLIWISIIDRKTCEHCCMPRDGYTSKEIEEMLANGDLDASECDAIVPPGHRFCRCRSGAATDDLPEKVPPDFGSWDQWLEDKGK